MLSIGSQVHEQLHDAHRGADYNIPLFRDIAVKNKARKIPGFNSIINDSPAKFVCGASLIF